MVPLFDHQRQAVDRALQVLRRSGGFYLAHDVGTGKTRTALTIAEELGVTRILVLCPVVALGVWVRQAALWSPDISVSVVRNSFSSLPERGIIATNYDQVVGHSARSRLSALLRWSPELLILDEAHYAKNPSAARTRACLELAKRSKYRLLLSGTPAHSPLDWWSQYRIVAPQEPMWAQRYSQYKEAVAIRGGPNGLWIVGFRPEKKKEALEAMAPYTHTASSELLSLPAPIETIIPVMLSSEELRIYHQMRRLFVASLPDGGEANASTVLTKFLRLHQISSGIVTDVEGNTRIIGSTKLRTCLELLDERSEKKVVVCCRFRPEIDRLAKALQAKKRPHAVIHGDIDPDERARIEDRFQGSDKPYVVILQPRAGGVSVTLTEAKALILCSLDPSVISFQQVLGRVWRAGQKGHVQVLPLLASGTLDVALYNGLKMGCDSMRMARLLANAAREATDAEG